MKPLQLPPAILLLMFGVGTISSAVPSSPIANVALASTGNGSNYASQCVSASSSYSSAYDSWSREHQVISTYTQRYGGSTASVVTYYVNATTLCDGHARVTYSPAITLAVNTTVTSDTPASSSIIVNSVYYAYPGPSPSCSISPSDCNPLWAAYSSSLSSWNAVNASAPQTTPALQMPPCANEAQASSFAAAESVIRGCGECTMFGEGVELVYFPVPSTSRDMCGSEPTASLTFYNSDAVWEVSDGKSYSGKRRAKEGDETAVVGEHTFTSGTAYISISTVYAVDRCSSTKGSAASNVIIAMPSASVLSLRYSQDHFQYLMSTDQQTGFPVSYGDFHTPIPWSAWNGQNICSNSYGGWMCDVIYENKFRAQLAIPPGIRSLRPEWADCQLWYNGLYDPPLALQPQTTIAKATQHSQQQTSDAPSATPGSNAATPTSYPTAVPQENGNEDSPSAETEAGESGPHQFSRGGHSYLISTGGDNAWVGSQSTSSGGATQVLTDGLEATMGSGGLIGGGGNAWVDSQTILSGGATQTLSDDLVAIVESEGLIGGGGSTVTLSHQQSSGATSAGTHLVSVITYEQVTVTAVQSAPGDVISVASPTLTPDRPVGTLAGGYVASAGHDGLVLGWSSTAGESADSASSTISRTSSTTTLRSSDGTLASTTTTPTSDSWRMRASPLAVLSLFLFGLAL